MIIKAQISVSRKVTGKPQWQWAKTGVLFQHLVLTSEIDGPRCTMSSLLKVPIPATCQPKIAEVVTAAHSMEPLRVATHRLAGPIEGAGHRACGQERLWS